MRVVADEVRIAGMERTTLALHPATAKRSAKSGRIGFHSYRHSELLPRPERERRSLHHAANETGLWRCPGTVRGLGRVGIVAQAIIKVQYVRQNPFLEGCTRWLAAF